MRVKIAKVTKTKRWFFERINKIDKPCLTHKVKKGEVSNQ